MKYFASLCLLILLVGCANHSIEKYRNKKPVLIPEVFFDGRLMAYGIVKNRHGNVIRTFKADIDAGWSDGTGVLDEKFVFDDGEKQHRRWQLIKIADGKYTATANDVIGSHTMSVAGNALFMNYLLQIEYNKKPFVVSVDDKMFLVSEKRIINESRLYKWGFHVGSVQLVIEKH